MFEIGDNIEYKIIVNNNSNEDYDLNKDSFNISSDYIDYTIESNDDSNIIKANSEKTVYLKIEYKNEVPKEAFEAGIYNDNKTMIVNLYTEDRIDIPETIKNPNTSDIIALIILLLLISGISFVLLKKKQYKKFMILIIGISTVIPISVYALCKCDIKIESNIVISNLYNGEIYRYSTVEVDLNENIENLTELKTTINDFTNEKDYVKDRDLINNDFYIKHIIKNNIITESYLCLSADKEYCFTGSFTTDEEILRELENYTTEQSGYCSYSGRPSFCSYNYIRAETWNSNATSIQFETVLFCGINGESKTSCFHD